MWRYLHHHQRHHVIFNTRNDAYKKSLITTPYRTSTNTRTRITHRSSSNYIDRDKLSLVSILKSLDASLKIPGTANADSILGCFKKLNKLGKVVPISFYLDAARIFTERRDVIRSELLIHIYRENLSIINSSNDKNMEKALQSHPKYDPLNKLISFSISGLFRYGCTDEANKLWVRMTNMGYVTNRVGMEKMLDRIVGATADSIPSLGFVDSLQKAMRAHHWNQTPRYYGRLMKVYYHFISKSCSTHLELQSTMEKLDAVWQEAHVTLLIQGVRRSTSDDIQSIGYAAGLPLELHALRIQCFVAAMSVCRLRLKGYQQSESIYTEQALIAFRDFVTITSSIGKEGGISLSKKVVDDMREEILGIAEETKNRFKANNTTNTTNYQQPLFVSDAVKNTTIPTQICDDSIVRAHNSLRSALGNSRKAIRLLLTTLSKQGQPYEAIALLRDYLQRQQQQQYGATSEGGSKRASSASYVSHSLSKSSAMFDLKQHLTSAAAVAAASSRTKTSSAKTADPSLLAMKSSGVILSEAKRGTVPRRMINNLVYNNEISQHTADDKAWQTELACDILRYSNVIVMNHSVSSDGADDGSRVLKDTKEVFSTLEDVVFTYQLKPGALFISSYIDAISCNMRFYESRGKKALLHWTTALSFINTLIDDLEDKVGRSSEVYHSIIKLLCSSSSDYPEAEALLEAISIVQQSKREKCPIYPASLCTILDTATVCLDDMHLHQVLHQLEGILKHPSVKLSLETDCLILRSRIYAYARLRQGFQGLVLLRRLRKIGGKAELRLYRWIINALHQASPCSDAEWMVAKYPATTIDFLLREMVRDGHRLDSDMIALILRLYTKSVQIHVSQGGYKKVLKEMEEFITRCGTIGFMSNLSIPINDTMIKELIKAHCIAGMERKVFQIINSAPKKYNVKLTAAFYEPILFYYAGIKGLNDIAEDVFMQMVNHQIPLTDATIVPMVLGHMKHGNLSDALDCIQDLFNQYRIRPTTSLWLLLIDASLKTGDVMEARRVVTLLNQLYSQEEREQSIGPMLRSELEAVNARSYFANKSIEDNKRSAVVQKSVSDNKEDNDNYDDDDDVYDSPRSNFNYSEDDEAIAQQRSKLAIWSYWYPNANDNVHKGGHYRSNDDYGYIDDDSNVLSAYSGYLPSHGYLLKLGVPSGQKQRGILSHEVLAKRFRHYGYSL